jgi:hypothetical protein
MVLLKLSPNRKCEKMKLFEHITKNDFISLNKTKTRTWINGQNFYFILEEFSKVDEMGHWTLKIELKQNGFGEIINVDLVGKCHLKSKTKSSIRIVSSSFILFWKRKNLKNAFQIRSNHSLLKLKDIENNLEPFLNNYIDINKEGDSVQFNINFSKDNEDLLFHLFEIIKIISFS